MDLLYNLIIHVISITVFLLVVYPSTCILLQKDKHDLDIIAILLSAIIYWLVALIIYALLSA